MDVRQPQYANVMVLLLAASQFERVFFSSISTLSNIEELGHHDDNVRMAVTMENTYQLGEIKLSCTVSFNQSSYWIMKKTYLTWVCCVCFEPQGLTNASLSPPSQTF